MRARITKKNRSTRGGADRGSFHLTCSAKTQNYRGESPVSVSGAEVAAQTWKKRPQCRAIFQERHFEPAVLQFSLINDLRELAATAEKVDAFCAEHGVSPDIAFAINVSVDELLTNTISYGYDDGEPHRIEMTVRVEDGVLVIELEDDARPYDPTQAPHPDTDAPIEHRPIGGLGVHFVRGLMDGFTYRRSDGRNIVTLTKRT